MSQVEHPAGIWKREFEKASNFSSGIDSVGALLAEHLEDDAAEVSAESADGLIVSLSFGAFFLVVALRFAKTVSQSWDVRCVPRRRARF